MPKPWMIYGANGYTGELIAREAVSRGLKPVLAGRTAAKVEPLAASLGLQARVFDLARRRGDREERRGDGTCPPLCGTVLGNSRTDDGGLPRRARPLP